MSKLEPATRAAFAHQLAAAIKEADAGIWVPSTATKAQLKDALDFYRRKAKRLSTMLEAMNLQMEVSEPVSNRARLKQLLGD